MLYYVLPNCSIALVPRVASMAIAMAAMQTYYFSFCGNLQTPLDYYRMMLNSTTQTPNPALPIYQLVRDPVTRFISALVSAQIAPADAVGKIGLLMQNDDHFRPQSQWQNTQAFQYETQIPQFCAAAGLPVPAVANDSVGAPTLTPAQTTGIQNLYASDVSFHNSLTAVSSS